VIGVGGDTVDVHGGHVFVNGIEISEPYIFEGQQTQLSGGGGSTWKLGPNQLFVMGDHRQVSQDSRDFGAIDKSEIIGRAWLRYWPASQFGVLPPAGQTAAPSAHAVAPNPSPAASPTS
jgi:signal peptidase I